MCEAHLLAVLPSATHRKYALDYKTRRRETFGSSVHSFIATLYIKTRPFVAGAPAAARSRAASRRSVLVALRRAPAMPFTGSSASSLSGDPFAAPLGDEYDPIALSQLARDADDALRTSTSVDDPDADSFQSTRRRDAVRALRRLAVDAEGPGAPFTKTPRGMQLLRLISVVVRNVGLSDKVGGARSVANIKSQRRGVARDRHARRPRRSFRRGPRRSECAERRRADALRYRPSSAAPSPR